MMRESKTPALPRWLLLLDMLLLAVNLRPAIAAVGPVMPLIEADLHLGHVERGVLGALPIAMFSVASVTVHRLVRRFGVEVTVAGALALLTVATALRSLPGPAAGLWVGTALVGAGIALGNVIMPVIVKRDFAGSAHRITGLYVATLGVGAGAAAALSVPLSTLSAHTWRLAVGVWAVLALLGLVAWLPRALRARPAPAAAMPDGGSPGSLWRDVRAWRLAAFMGMQSGGFYIILTWLPTAEQSFGYEPATTGWHMLIFQSVAIVGNLITPRLMQTRAGERRTAILSGVLLVAAAGGFWLAPGAGWLWAGMLGLGTGFGFVAALTLLTVRAGDVRSATRLSSMSQSMGYAISTAALLVAGIVSGLGGGAVMAAIGVSAVAIIALGPAVTRRYTILA